MPGKVDWEVWNAAVAKLPKALRVRRRALEKLLGEVNDHWGYEDGMYRFYHHSFKVYRLQEYTEEIANALRTLVPWNMQFNRLFTEIYNDGTGKVFHYDHNAEWSKHTRPIVEAFLHAKYYLEMAVKYANAFKEGATGMMPSGWAALTGLYVPK